MEGWFVRLSRLLCALRPDAAHSETSRFEGSSLEGFDEGAVGSGPTARWQAIAL